MQHSAHTTISITLLSLTTLLGCPLIDKQIGDPPTAGDTGTDTATSTSGDGDGDGTSTTDEDAELFDNCLGPFSTPKIDLDCDGVGLSCDNARDHLNPNQLDQDEDGFGDVADLCPLLEGPTNTADSDRDGIGNACDRCWRPPEHYQVAGIDDPRLWVRAIPDSGDFDHDGIGDACDNCVSVANCSIWNPDEPAPHGVDTPSDDLEICQTDEDEDGIGDACMGGDSPQAAGPVGFGSADDFDQDGIINMEDGCPRLPVAPDYAQRIPCDADEDCPSSTVCASVPAHDAQRYCNHSDADGDLVGDACDTCVFAPNPLQVTDAGMLIDDDDGDFVGSVCEQASACAIRKDPRKIGFYDVVVNGQCCVQTYPGDGVIHDPDGIPVIADCTPEDEEAQLCRSLPATVLTTPGMVQLAAGCDQALADAGVLEATALTLEDVDEDMLALWSHACRMPPLDHDFDGIGDACDLCVFAFDPGNAPYVDENDMVWPNAGAACEGEYVDQPGAACIP